MTPRPDSKCAPGSVWSLKEASALVPWGDTNIEASFSGQTRHTRWCCKQAAVMVGLCTLPVVPCGVSCAAFFSSFTPSTPTRTRKPQHSPSIFSSRDQREGNGEEGVADHRGSTWDGAGRRQCPAVRPQLVMISFWSVCPGTLRHFTGTESEGVFPKFLRHPPVRWVCLSVPVPCFKYPRGRLPPCVSPGQVFQLQGKHSDRKARFSAVTLL